MMPEQMIPNRAERRRRSALLRRFIRRFGGDEDGGLIVFSLYLFVVMMLIGGLAVDMMRYEVVRVRLQSTLDRAVLAAASINQTLEPAAVVADYFTKAGLNEFLETPVVVDEGLNFRVVEATASAEVPMIFLDMFNPVFPSILNGLESMDAVTTGAATESVEDIEISLVLDISTSMGPEYSTGDEAKIDQLKEAAKAFVEIVYNNDDYEDISISIVPYSTQVGVGEEILSQYNVSWYHNFSACIDFNYDDFNATQISQTQRFHQTPHFDPWNIWGPLDDRGVVLHQCRTDASSEILPLTNIEDDLNAYIDALTAGGNTSIEIGVKWGAAMLDPSFQPVVNHLITEGIVPQEFAGRPFAPQIGASRKILVVMTDGVNTEEFGLPNYMRTGLSDVYYDPVCGNYYIDSREKNDDDGDDRSNERFYVPHFDYWSEDWSEETEGEHWRRNNKGIDCQTRTGSITQDTERLSYMQLNDHVSMVYNAFYHWATQHSDWDDFEAHYNDILSTRAQYGEKDERMERICDAAKAEPNRLHVYTIGFEVNDHAAAVMEDCASSAATFYRVSGGDELRKAFEAIARQVTELRLIQ